MPAPILITGTVSNPNKNPDSKLSLITVGIGSSYL